jgi:hypothetical protein
VDLVVVQVLAQVVDLAVVDLVADLAVADFLVVDLVVDGKLDVILFSFILF